VVLFIACKPRLMLKLDMLGAIRSNTVLLRTEYRSKKGSSSVHCDGNCISSSPRNLPRITSNLRYADYTTHGRSNFMAHVGEKSCGLLQVASSAASLAAVLALHLGLNKDHRLAMLSIISVFTVFTTSRLCRFPPLRPLPPSLRLHCLSVLKFWRHARHM
jgi:hypothetical protein